MNIKDIIKAKFKAKGKFKPITGEERLAGAKLPQEGTWTASETGARQLAELRAGIRHARAVLDAAESTKSFEDYIKGGK